jgi:hypothetical protein
VHPLWYSPIVYVLFFVSAVGLGLMMVTLESLLSSWFFGHKARPAVLGGLGAAASVVLFVYVALRLGDLLVRGQLTHAFDGSWQSWLFLFELSVSALLPAVLLAFRRIRQSVGGLSACSALAVLGMIGYRFDICIVTFTRPDGLPYVPTWMEIAISAGVVAGAILTFIFFVEKFRVTEPEQHPEPFIQPRDDTAGTPEALPAVFASPRRYSLIFVVAAAFTAGVLPADAVFGPQPKRTPVAPPRTVDAQEVRLDGGARRYVIPGLGAADDAASGAQRTGVKLMLINGNRDERWVPFDHAGHVAELGGDEACTQCHHQNFPFDQNTSCSQCHRDMYEVTDTFVHASHVSATGGNSGCVQCHEADPDRKTRSSAKRCAECHGDMIVRGARVAAPEGGLTGFAVSYMDAMHGLCIACHEETAQTRNRPNHARCDTCHRPELDPVDPADLVLRESSSRAAAGPGAGNERSGDGE